METTMSATAVTSCGTINPATIGPLRSGCPWRIDRAPKRIVKSRMLQNENKPIALICEPLATGSHLMERMEC